LFAFYCIFVSDQPEMREFENLQIIDDVPERLAASLREMLPDPLFEGASVSGRELKAIAASSPHLVRSMLDLHASYRRIEERYRSLDDALQQGADQLEASKRPFSFDEVRDFFQLMGNYADVLDRSAEALAEGL
jgi:hypothetical protein